MKKTSAKKDKPKATTSALRRWEVKPNFGEPTETVAAVDWHLSEGRLEFVKPGAAECCAIFNRWEWFREL